MKTFTLEFFRRWGAKGGAKSKRELTPEQARAMVRSREKKRNLAADLLKTGAMKKCK